MLKRHEQTIKFDVYEVGWDGDRSKLISFDDKEPAERYVKQVLQDNPYALISLWERRETTEEFLLFRSKGVYL